jgi:DNA-binding protein H-NS
MGNEAWVRTSDLNSIPIDELWALHEKLGKKLVARIVSEQALLEARLDQLQRPPGERQVRGRRPYPPVSPKYRNPNDPSETWSGRGKLPRWLVPLLKSGLQIEDFRIGSGAEASRMPRNRNAK